MGGRPWDDLTAAFDTFIARRVYDQGFNDLVSIVKFASTANEVCRRVQMSASLRLPGHEGGGTDFIPALDQARSIFSASNLPDEVPVLIFMSDGASWGNRTRNP